MNQEAFVLFVDLVKAFDTVNRTMLWQILAKYGVPETLISVIRKMYQDVNIIGDVNGISFSFKSLSGVKQGDNLSPVLFLFAIQAVLESMSKSWPAAKPRLQLVPESREKLSVNSYGNKSTPRRLGFLPFALC